MGGQSMSFDGLTVVVSIIFIVIFLTAIITIIYVPGLITDKPVFLRESADAMYRPLSERQASQDGRQGFPFGCSEEADLDAFAPGAVPRGSTRQRSERRGHSTQQAWGVLVQLLSRALMPHV